MERAVSMSARGLPRVPLLQLYRILASFLAIPLSWSPPLVRPVTLRPRLSAGFAFCRDCLNRTFDARLLQVIQPGSYRCEEDGENDEAGELQLNLTSTSTPQSRCHRASAL